MGVNELIGAFDDVSASSARACIDNGSTQVSKKGEGLGPSTVLMKHTVQ